MQVPALSSSQALLLAFLAVAPLTANAQVMADKDAGETRFKLHSFSLQPPFIDHNLENKWWNFGGDAIMEVNKHIRLTQDKPSKSGWVWSKEPVTATSWSIEFDFKVHSEHTGMHGDGFAFWYTREREQRGPVFGNKDYFQGLGVFFDTYANARHKHGFPYINAMTNDGKLSYDVGDDGAKTQIGGCSSNFRQRDHPTRAKITYVKSDYLKVEVDVKGSGQWEDCFTSYNVTLPLNGHFGFTALTGDASDTHDLLSVTSYGISKPNHLMPKLNDQPLATTQASNAGWGFFTKLFFLIALSAVGYVAYVALKKRETSSYKRF
ncbi:hypothetical protein HDU85_005008 [Gaertneriomyces sp. JEL0708]|nr:hypothetical protein HDU85_005008 [Gaertneriomyces sp. JEL0708]